MQQNEVQSILVNHQDTIKSYGVRTLFIFGSVARDEATAESDVDILVEFEGAVTFERYMDLKFYLEDQLRTKVDLVTKRSLKPQIRASVEQEVIRIP
ncbi:MAG: nucleotidyltransferase family protein [Symploca sp. SIO1A3]|nr:nucleotidyltransferase family protein [Symploca sp. SIO1A3]